MENRVREMRARLGLTQRELAEQVRVSSRTIISIETGQYKPSLLLAYRLAEALGLGMEELFCLRENREKEDELYEKSAR